MTAVTVQNPQGYQPPPDSSQPVGTRFPEGFRSAFLETTRITPPAPAEAPASPAQSPQEGNPPADPAQRLEPGAMQLLPGFSSDKMGISSVTENKDNNTFTVELQTRLADGAVGGTLSVTVRPESAEHAEELRALGAALEEIDQQKAEIQSRPRQNQTVPGNPSTPEPTRSKDEASPSGGQHPPTGTKPAAGAQGGSPAMGDGISFTGTANIGGLPVEVSFTSAPEMEDGRDPVEDSLSVKISEGPLEGTELVYDVEKQRFTCNNVTTDLGVGSLTWDPTDTENPKWKLSLTEGPITGELVYNQESGAFTGRLNGELGPLDVTVSKNVRGGDGTTVTGWSTDIKFTDGDGVTYSLEYDAVETERQTQRGEITDIADEYVFKVKGADGREIGKVFIDDGKIAEISATVGGREQSVKFGVSNLGIFGAVPVSANTMPDFDPRAVTSLMRDYGLVVGPDEPARGSGAKTDEALAFFAEYKDQTGAINVPGLGALQEINIAAGYGGADIEARFDNAVFVYRDDSWQLKMENPDGSIRFLPSGVESVTLARDTDGKLGLAVGINTDQHGKCSIFVSPDLQYVNWEESGFNGTAGFVDGQLFAGLTYSDGLFSAVARYCDGKGIQFSLNYEIKF